MKVYIQLYFGGIYTLNIININQIGFSIVMWHNTSYKQSTSMKEKLKQILWNK
jgi:hypothetical protein